MPQSSSFDPIAIVGRACVLPGALSPEQLWELVLAGKDVLGSAPDGRWGLATEHALARGSSCEDRSWTDRGGYVRAFEQCFDPSGFAIEEEDVAGLDPLFQWVLHTAREALRDAGHETSKARVGAVFGNLSFPSASMSRYAESVWMDTLAKNPDSWMPHTHMSVIRLQQLGAIDRAAEPDRWRSVLAQARRHAERAVAKKPDDPQVLERGDAVEQLRGVRRRHAALLRLLVDVDL